MRLLFPRYAEDPSLAERFAFRERAVRAVFVSSLDGAATVNGRAGDLGNDTDRRLFALHRSLADVIVVGAGTVRIEGYGPAEPSKEWAYLRGDRPPTAPIAVVSADLSLDPASALFTEAPADARTIVLTCANAAATRREALAEVADVIVAGESVVELPRAFDVLADRGLRRVSCEGGPTLMAGVAAAGRLDELCLTLSPQVVAGDGPRISNGPAIADVQQMQPATIVEDAGYLYLLYRRV